ncbi:thermonuclease family protein [Actinomycetospora sp. OC33-EN08]|uniref:Thermonuclease family protein n=1 Tax=Actinomycetospora aurantiaca TaxID=3129233 RepID=A0ABU8MVP2_9PSEU
MGEHGRHGSGPTTGAHRALRREPVRLRLALAALGVLGLGVAVGLLVAPGESAGPTGLPGAPGPAAPAAVVATPAGSATPAMSHPTLLGEVVRVDTGDEVVVRVDGTEHAVAILGITAPRSAGPRRATGECGAAEALRFADRTLSGQTVTLVPDPSVPETDDAGRRLAYVVLASQLNFTDAALLAGVVTVDTTQALHYAPVFAREQQEAVTADRGLWGAPCRAEPGRPLPAGR